MEKKVSRATLAASLAICLAAASGAAGLAHAHHSFAAFFDSEKTKTVTGEVTKFQFVNPHGTIELDVKAPDGKTEVWRVETNSPSILRRLGWTKDSIQIGQTVTIVGWLSRDGSNYMRLQGASDKDGKPIGRPMNTVEQK
jgi:hypothetical protein